MREENLWQKQRLALARALSVKSSVLILDEPTSSLDMKSSNIIKNTLNKLKKDKIIIIISHDHSILEDATLVYRVNNKKIEVCE